MKSTGQELAPVIALVPVEEFRRLGVVPTYFDADSKRLKLICSTTMDESKRSEISSRLPDMDIEWHLADDKVFDFMYQRIAGEYPAQAMPSPGAAPGAPADKNDTGPDKAEKPADGVGAGTGEVRPSMETDKPEQAVPEYTSSETGQTTETDASAAVEPDIMSHDMSRPADSDESAKADHDAEPREAEPPVDTVENTAPTPDENPEPEDDSIVPPGQKTILFVTPAGHIAQHLVFALNAERCQAVTVTSLDQATKELERQSIACVFIHEKLHGQRHEFIRHIQNTSPEIPVRLYHSEVSVLMNDTRELATGDLIRQNLTLFSRLHDSSGSAIAEHAAVVARFADRMAARLNIPYHYRPVITTAAFLHNMEEENLKDAEGLQQTDIIGLSASRLESWDFPLPVVRLLRRMYTRADDNVQQAGGVEAMGGDILTTVDVFCHLWPDCSSAGYQVDLVRSKLEGQLQGRVLPSVVDSLIDIVRDDSTAQLLRPGTFSVHIFESGGSRPAELIRALEEGEFGVTFSSDISDCVQSCCDTRADVLIIRDPGSVQDVYDTLMSLALQGLALNQLQIVLLLNQEMVTDALRLLSHGVEEILPASAPPQAVVTKLARIRNRLEAQYRHRVSLTERLGTHGSLGDMCLADILETLRGNRKPTRISVTAYGDQLTVYLDKGRIISADCENTAGPEALLKGISWRQGVWNIESVDAPELPEPNIDQSIDTVLIEACTRLDEAAKDDPVYDLVP